MSRYIDIEPIEKQIEFELTIGQCKTFSEREEGVLNIYDAIKNAPTADVEEVKHGEWKDCGSIWDVVDEYEVWRCSNCIIPNYKKTRYCPNCGARMREDKEE